MEKGIKALGLDILLNDKDQRVRRKVARHGYGLDILVKDEDYDVRAEAVKQLKLRNK
jgi:hypothetical protein